MCSNFIKFITHNITNRPIAFFFIFLLFQTLFWYNTQHIKPRIKILPDLQSKKMIEALSFGDKEFYFRVLSTKLQNSGDRFGQFTSLRKYDYEKLYNWLHNLADLNYKSKFTPAIATYYYSSTIDKHNVAWIVKFLEEYSEKNIDENWWWMFQATTLANSALEDKAYALRLAKKLSINTNPDAPFFTKQMPAIIHAKMNEDCESFLLMKELADNYDETKERVEYKGSLMSEIQFMNIFIKTRLQKLKEKNFDPSKCRIKN